MDQLYMRLATILTANNHSPMPKDTKSELGKDHCLSQHSMFAAFVHHESEVENEEVSKKRVNGIEPTTFSLGRAGRSIVNGIEIEGYGEVDFALHKRLHTDTGSGGINGSFSESWPRGWALGDPSVWVG